MSEISRSITALLLILALLVPASVFCADIESEAFRGAFEATRKAEGAVLDDYALIDQDGVGFHLSEYFKTGRPLVISYIYTGCPHVCPTITRDFIGAAEKARERLGDRFDLLTVTFDPERDTPARLREYALKFTKDLKRYRFATADEATIRRLAGQTGFYYTKKDDGSFDHIDMATIVASGGVVFRQAYSIRTRPEALVDLIDEAVTGRPQTGASATIVDKIKFFCYKYDPSTGRYVIDYALFGSVIMQGLVIGAVIYAVWGKRIMARLTGRGRGDGSA